MSHQREPISGKVTSLAPLPPSTRRIFRPDDDPGREMKIYPNEPVFLAKLASNKALEGLLAKLEPEQRSIYSQMLERQEKRSKKMKDPSEEGWKEHNEKIMAKLEKELEILSKKSEQMESQMIQAHDELRKRSIKGIYIAPGSTTIGSVRTNVKEELKSVGEQNLFVDNFKITSEASRRQVNAASSGPSSRQPTLADSMVKSRQLRNDPAAPSSSAQPPFTTSNKPDNNNNLPHSSPSTSTQSFSSATA